MTARDRTIVIVVLVVGAFGGFWLGVLGPKRKDAKALDASIATVQSRLDQANANANQAEAAKKRYEDDYTAVVRLGKAVPGDASTPSLVYQLESAVRRAKMDLRSVKFTVPATASGSSAAPAGNAASGPSTANSSSPSSTSSTPSATPATTAATPAAPSASSSPASATGFEALPFTFVVTGGFFNARQLLDALDQFVSVHGSQVSVRGRLVSIDGFSLQASPRGLPHMQANVSATAYVLPASEGLTGGATVQGPAGSSPTATGGGSSVATPTATVTGIAR